VNKQKKLLLLFLLAILFLSQLRISAMQPQSDESASSTNVLILNAGNQTITFWLRNGNSNWAKFQLDAGDNNTYKNADQIWVITTGKSSVHYRLEMKHRYKIVWNYQSAMWDVLEHTFR
jgi:hypothetical protein